MKLEQWLPKPKQGDIVLLRQVKVPRIMILLDCSRAEDASDSALERQSYLYLLLKYNAMGDL
jgi:hypothetical protein